MVVAQFRDRETDHGQSRDGPNPENARNISIRKMQARKMSPIWYRVSPIWSDLVIRVTADCVALQTVFSN